MTEEIKDPDIEAQIATFLEHPSNYTLEQANKLLREWVAYEDDIEANAKAYAEKMKIASILAKSVHKYNKDPKINAIKEGFSDFVTSVKARTIILGDMIKKKLKR